MRLAGFAEAGDRVAVRLDDGTVVEADAGVVGIGGTPRLDWLDGESPPTYDPGPGLRCDPSGRVHGWDGVWAVGDVALWDDPVDGTARRHEHWTSAGDQAAVVARDILGAAPPPADRALLLVRPVRAQDPAARPARAGRHRAAAARGRASTAARCAARWPGTSPPTGWWPWSASARRAWWPATARWSPTARPAPTVLAHAAAR